MPFSRGSSRPEDWTQVSCVSCTGRAGPLPPAPPGETLLEAVASEEGRSHHREKADMCIWMWGENVKACVYA